MYVELDTTSVSGRDTVTKVLYTYDSLKSLSSFQFLQYSPIGILDTDSYTILYRYSAMDTVPYKSIKKYHINGINEAGTKTYKYTNGQLTFDSTYDNNEELINRYVCSGNKIVDSGLYYQHNLPITNKFPQVVYQQNMAGRIVLQKDTFVYNCDIPVAADTVSSSES